MSWLGTYAVPVVDGVAVGLLLFCVAAGLTLTFGVMRVFSMVHGTLYLVGGYTAWALFDGGWSGLVLAVTAGVGIGVVAGGLLQTAMRPLAGRHLDQALATLGVAFIAGEVLSEVFGAQPLPTEAPTAVAGSIPLAGHLYPVWRLVFIGVGTALAIGLFLTLERSRAGALVRAVVADPAMAAATGIPVRRVQTAVLAVGGALAVGAGVLGAPVLGPGPGVDSAVLVQSLIVVVVGGLGSIRGALVAALGVGQISTLGVVLAPTASAFLLAAAMFVALVVRRPAYAAVGVSA